MRPDLHHEDCDYRTSGAAAEASETLRADDDRGVFDCNLGCESEALHDMARGYITAALWADAERLCDCGALDHDHLDARDDIHSEGCAHEEHGGLEGLEVRAEDYVFVRELCRRFVDAAGDDLVTFANLRSFDAAEGSVWSHIGRDLRLTSCRHGTGFWDRESSRHAGPESDSGYDDVFDAARNALTVLAQSRPFGLAEHYGVWQATEDTCHFDWFPLEPDAAPGDRWEPPTLTSAQRQCWIEEGIVPTPEEMSA